MLPISVKFNNYFCFIFEASAKPNFIDLPIPKFLLLFKTFVGVFEDSAKELIKFKESSVEQSFTTIVHHNITQLYIECHKLS